MPRRNRVTPFGELVDDRPAGSSTGTAAASTTRTARSGVATRGSAGSPAGSSSAAGSGSCCSPAGSRSCSSSTRRPRSPPATVRARVCRYEDYQDFVTLWHELHPGDGPAATRSTRGCTRSGSSPATRAQRRHAAPFETLPDGTFVVARRRCPSSCSATGCCGGRRAATRRPTAPAERDGGRAHAAVARRGPPERLAGCRAAAASVGGSPATG